jgi:hypothetical protein
VEEISKQIISMNEARKLLGVKSKYITNKELQQLIDQTETVVRLVLKEYVRSKKLQNNASMKPGKTVEQ